MNTITRILMLGIGFLNFMACGKPEDGNGYDVTISNRTIKVVDLDGAPVPYFKVCYTVTALKRDKDGIYSNDAGLSNSYSWNRETLVNSYDSCSVTDAKGEATLYGYHALAQGPDRKGPVEWAVQSPTIKVVDQKLNCETTSKNFSLVTFDFASPYATGSKLQILAKDSEIALVPATIEYKLNKTNAQLKDFYQYNSDSWCSRDWSY